MPASSPEDSERTNAPATAPGEARFRALATAPDRGSLSKYRVQDRGRDLTWADVLDNWERDPAFVDFFNSTLKDCGFDAFRWETPPLCSDTAGRAFEFVLHDTPAAWSSPDRTTFARHFDSGNADHGIVALDNLGGDARLVVPSPPRPAADYRDLAMFLATAPINQQRALWNVLAREARALLADRPRWISVAGGGVAWLHVRLDSRPKYYRYAPYKSPPPH